MREHLSALYDRLFPPPTYTDRFYDVFNRGAAAVSRAGHDAGRFGSSSLRSIDRSWDQAQHKLADYGLTPEMIASLAAPQLRQLQRTAMKAATRRPAATLGGSLFVLGALGVIAYAISRESKLSAPTVVRSRD